MAGAITQDTRVTMNSISQLIDLAMAEDVGPGDITTENLIDPVSFGTAVIVAKEPAVIAGIHMVQEVFRRLDPEIVITSDFMDGDAVETGAVVLTIEGSLRALLIGERTALNFLQRLSGIATQTSRFVAALAGRSVRLVDTRKTLPGWRALEKYAVRVGGAKNHRMGLYDGVLIKDNHIAACGGIQNAVTMLREEISHLTKIEVETSDLSQVEEALAVGVDVIMLDNMALPMIRKAVAMIAGKALVEVSGNVTLATVSELADTGVDIISAGALTHSAPNIDLSMRIQNQVDS